MIVITITCYFTKYNTQSFLKLTCFYNFKGAIFGPRICGAFSGWKSEFDSREECVEALRYFLDHSLSAKLTFQQGGEQMRLADVPLVACMHASPATVAVQVQRPDVFQLLVQYGAVVHEMPFVSNYYFVGEIY